MSEGDRRLAAIMYTDIVGFTALTQSDETQTLAVLERHNRLLRPIFPRYHGREVKSIGDSFLVEFESALDATNCAIEAQRFLHDYNISSRDEWRITLRIGIHLGDVVRSGSDILGDAVNIASRLQPLAEPEGVCISQQVYDQVRNKVPQALVKLEPHDLKGVRFQVDVYKVVMPWEQAAAVEVPTFATNRIAILPFTSFSPDPNDTFFADGVTDEIISAVAGISGLSVISRTSVMGYKGTTKKVEEIGRELKVGSVLEGSFKKAGNRIRVTTQLINVAEDKHLWAQNYDRNLDDVFEVQSDVAKQVAEALRVKILAPEKERIEKKPTESTAAYTYYLRGRSIWNRRGLENMKKAMEYFELAVKEDPGFALGYVGQADCAILLRNTHDIDREENLVKSKTMLERALQLDPALAEAHTTLGMVYLSDYNIRRAEGEFRRAIELKPSYATAHQWYYHLLTDKLEWDEALKEIEKAVELDPLSAILLNNLGGYYYQRRDFNTAAEKWRIVVDLGTEWGHWWLGLVYGQLKLYDEMEKEFEIDARHYEHEIPGVRTTNKAYKAYFKGDKETVRKLLPELEVHPKETGMNAISIASLHFFLGDVDKGFEWLERAYSRKESDLMSIQHDLSLDSFRADPRYLDLLKRLGLD
ncbi:MAG TPA: adenylate/guanylate cyclase domain-containing protein [Nitrososphaerales archaeon]|nr:adenylate/guanylate cyclase domain-containing protein [Nitrososphaerales archaeon]